MNRRLYRCSHDKRVAGVASGLAEYFDLDPSLVRVLWILSIFLGGMGILLYIAMAIVVPLEPEGYVPGGTPGFAPGGAPIGDPSVPAGPVTGEAPVAGPTPTGWHTWPVAEHRHVARGTGRGTTYFGIVLILFGALALVDSFLPAWADNGRFLWPAFLIGIGAILVASALRRESTQS